MNELDLNCSHHLALVLDRYDTGYCRYEGRFEVLVDGRSTVAAVHRLMSQSVCNQYDVDVQTLV